MRKRKGECVHWANSFNFMQTRKVNLYRLIVVKLLWYTWCCNFVLEIPGEISVLQEVKEVAKFLLGLVCSVYFLVASS